MTAARTGKIAVVKALLSHGAAVEAKESQGGQTALMWAAAEGNVQVVEALLHRRGFACSRALRIYTVLVCRPGRANGNGSRSLKGRGRRE